MKNKDFCAFILTHGRPDRVVTYNTLIKAGYTGRVYIVIDNEDKQADEYYKNFGDKVIMFDKKAISDTFDEGDNFEDRRCIVYARNACFEIAKNLGIKYFIQLDDDYTSFRFTGDNKGNYKGGNKPVRNINATLDSLVDFYKNTNVHSIAMAQGGDFIGGENSNVWKRQFNRKCMNSFICSTERPFQFIGRINEDVNTYTNLATRGYLFVTTALLRLEQIMTQSNKGGMTDLYLDSGTYIKSFYTVMYQPSSVDIRLMGAINQRLHHSVSWKHTTPQIVKEDYKK